eukprot:8007890-Heterocapsa_arctica.AAC.1
MRNPGKTFEHAPGLPAAARDLDNASKRRTGAQRGGQTFRQLHLEGPSAAAVKKVRERIRDWLGTVEETLP